MNSILLVSLSRIFVNKYVREFIYELRLITTGEFDRNIFVASFPAHVEDEFEVELHGCFLCAVIGRIDDDVVFSLLLSPSFLSEDLSSDIASSSSE